MATQDGALRGALGRMPAAPTLFISVNGLHLEAPSAASRDAVKQARAPRRPRAQPAAARARRWGRALDGRSALARWCDETLTPTHTHSLSSLQPPSAHLHTRPQEEDAALALPAHERRAEALRDLAAITPKLTTNVRFRKVKTRGPNPLSVRKKATKKPAAAGSSGGAAASTSGGAGKGGAVAAREGASAGGGAAGAGDEAAAAAKRKRKRNKKAKEAGGGGGGEAD